MFIKIFFYRRKPKSPLRYPGGKFRAVKLIREYFPETKGLISPFIGGGSIEVDRACNCTRVKAYDLFGPLVCFWQFLLTDKQSLYNAVREYYPITKESFTALQEQNHQLEWGLEKAAAF